MRQFVVARPRIVRASPAIARPMAVLYGGRPKVPAAAALDSTRMLDALAALMREGVELATRKGDGSIDWRTAAAHVASVLLEHQR